MATQSIYQSRPLTPYLLFCEKERKKDSSVTMKELGDKWQKLSESQKKKYQAEYKAAKEKFDKFLQEVYGNEPLTYRPEGKPIEFSLPRVRAILGQKPGIKPMAKGLYPGLVKALVRFLAAKSV